MCSACSPARWVKKAEKLASASLKTPRRKDEGTPTWPSGHGSRRQSLRWCESRRGKDRAAACASIDMRSIANRAVPGRADTPVRRTSGLAQVVVRYFAVRRALSDQAPTRVDSCRADKSFSLTKAPRHPCDSGSVSNQRSALVSARSVSAIRQDPAERSAELHAPHQTIASGSGFIER